MDFDELIKPEPNEEEIEITDSQWEIIKKEWNKRPDKPPSILELTQLVFKRPNLDGRSKEGRAIKIRLAEASLRAPTTAYDDRRKGVLDLSEGSISFITNNYRKMKAIEMARVIFDNNHLTNLCQETRTVSTYIKENLKTSESFEDTDEVPNGNYAPPKTSEGVVRKINKYRFESIDRDRMTGKQRKDVNSLLGYLNTFRFRRQINTYTSSSDRDLFESTFLRYTYDKFDLTEEEVDQYILLATEVVFAASIQHRLEILNQRLDEASQGEDKSISMSWVEAIGKTQSDYNSCITRQQKLLDSLKVKRSEKEGKNKEGSASILNLVQMWKDEDSRRKMIKFAEKKKEILKKGVEELMSMEELKCRLLGIDMDEILNG